MNRRQTKECIGCGDVFITFKNYDYCVDCAINNNRYLTSSDCPECDGSGIIKFPGHKPRPCKICALTKKNMTKKPLPKLSAEEKFWAEVDGLAQKKIYQLLIKNIPFQNTPLIKETWNYAEQQQQLTGLFLTRDTDYCLLLNDIENQYSEAELPEPEYLAEEVALCYFRLVIKSLIGELTNYSVYDPSHFTNLTNHEY